MNAKTVHSFADISALILALKPLNIERITLTDKPIPSPILHDSLAVLYFILSNKLIVVITGKLTYSIPLEDWFWVTSDGAYKTDYFAQFPSKTGLNWSCYHWGACSVQFKPLILDTRMKLCKTYPEEKHQ